MAFKQHLSQRLESGSTSLDTLVENAVRNDTIQGEGVEPTNGLVYNRSLKNVLEILGDTLSVATDAQQEAWKHAEGNKSEQEKISSQYASFVNALFSTQYSSSQTFGQRFTEALTSWYDQRAHMLDIEHKKVENLLSKITGETPKPYLGIQVEIYDSSIPGSDKAYSKKIPLDSLIPEDIATFRVNEQQRKRIKEIKKGSFPTEEEARNIVYKKLDSIEESLFGAPNGNITRLYEQGKLNITTLNISELNEGNGEKRRIQSRLKSGRANMIDSEAYKLFEAMTGQRDDYSYDSVALMLSGVTPEEITKTLLSYHASHNTQHLSITPENNTPGSHLHFLNELQDITREESNTYIREIGRAQQHPQGEMSKNALIKRWVANEPIDTSFGNEREIRQYFDEALHTIAAQYQEFIEDQARRDKKIVQNQTDKTYIDSVIGFDGELIRTQQSQSSSPEGEVNVPLEFLVMPFSNHYKNGAGSLYKAVFNESVDGPRKGEGNHKDYASKRLQRKQSLKQRGQLKAYAEFQKLQPRLF